MNNLAMAPRSGVGSSKKPIATYGKHSKRIYLSSALPLNNSEAAKSSTRSNGQEKSLQPKSRLLPIGRPRHHLVQRPSLQSTNVDAYDLGSEDEDGNDSLTTTKQPRKVTIAAETSSKPSKTTKAEISKLTNLTFPPRPSESTRQKSPPKPAGKMKPSKALPPEPKVQELAPKPASPSHGAAETPRDTDIRKIHESSSITPEQVKQPSVLVDVPRPGKRSLPAPSSPPRALRFTKRRLIDELVAQADSDTDVQSDDSDASSSTLPPTREQEHGVQAQGLFSPQLHVNPRREAWARRTPQNNPAGVKFTYSSQRTLLPEVSSISATTIPDPYDDLLALGPPTSSYDFEEDDPDTSQAGGIRSLHELRQAGASSRFSDGMEDLLDRIGSVQGKPSSMRRSGLIELVKKLDDKSWRRQFRDFGGDTRLFSGIEQETDVISGAAMAAAFLSLLAAGKATHITNKMPAKDLINLLGPLLDEKEDMSKISRRRGLSLSKVGQANFVSLSSSVCKLSIWDSTFPETISPRLLALKCLDLALDQLNDGVLEMLVSSSVISKVFAIMSESLEESLENMSPKGDSCLLQDLTMALKILKVCSVKAMESTERQKWTIEHLPMVMKALRTTLEMNTQGVSKIRSLVIQLTLNMTNDSPEAAELAGRDEVMGLIVNRLRDELALASSSIAGERLSSDAVEDVVLLLGVMINFCEHSPSARTVVAECDVLDDLIRPLLSHHRKTSEVSSRATSWQTTAANSAG